jgi:DNA polymerase-3 subunit epsilon
MHEQKINAGAGNLLNRSRAVVALTGPAVLVTNIAVPSITADDYSIYFLPDRLLARTRRTLRAFRTDR